FSEIHPLSLHDALPILAAALLPGPAPENVGGGAAVAGKKGRDSASGGADCGVKNPEGAHPGGSGDQAGAFTQQAADLLDIGGFRSEKPTSEPQSRFVVV